jgi:hypothetical protein
VLLQCYRGDATRSQSASIVATKFARMLASRRLSYVQVDAAKPTLAGLDGSEANEVQQCRLHTRSQLQKARDYRAWSWSSYFSQPP